MRCPMSTIEEVSSEMLYNAMTTEVKAVSNRINRLPGSTLCSVEIIFEGITEKKDAVVLLKVKERIWTIGPVSSTCFWATCLGVALLLERTFRTIAHPFTLFMSFFNPLSYLRNLTQKAFVGGVSLVSSYCWNVVTSKPSHRKVLQVFSKALEKVDVDLIKIGLKEGLEKSETEPNSVTCTVKVQIIRNGWIFGKTVNYETKKIRILDQQT